MTSTKSIASLESPRSSTPFCRMDVKEKDPPRNMYVENTGLSCLNHLLHGGLSDPPTEISCTSCRCQCLRGSTGSCPLSPRPVLITLPPAPVRSISLPVGTHTASSVGDLHAGIPVCRALHRRRNETGEKLTKRASKCNLGFTSPEFTAILFMRDLP
jgi:hypothetical protein